MCPTGRLADRILTVRYLVVLSSVLLMAGTLAAQEKKPKQSRWIGKHLPSFTVKSKHWVNRSTPPRTSELRGKVLYVQFGFLG